MTLTFAENELSQVVELLSEKQVQGLFSRMEKKRKTGGK